MTKKRKKHFKTWDQAKEEIEHALYLRTKYGGDEEMCVQSGLMLKHTISHYPSPIFEIAFHEDRKNGIEMYAINYVASDSGESCIAEWSYDPKEGHAHMVSKSTMQNHLKLCAFITSQQALIGYCGDLTIRAYSLPGFEEKYRMSVSGTVLDMLYIEEYDELITCGRGFVSSWRIKLIEIGLPLEPKEPPLFCDVFDTMEWVRSIQFDKATKTLLVLTDDSMYILSMVTRKQIATLSNTHETSLTGCAYYRPFSYSITAARDGTINIYNTETQTVIERFSGHRDGITGVATLTQQPIMISWSKSSGSLKMWRLDTMEIINETTLSEPILELKVVRNDRLYYRSHSDLRIFEMNALFSVFCTLTGNVESLKVCEIRRTHLNSDNDIEPNISAVVRFSDELDLKPKSAVGENQNTIAVGDCKISKNVEIKSALKHDVLQDKTVEHNSQGDMADKAASNSGRYILEDEIKRNNIQVMETQESNDKSNSFANTNSELPPIPIIIIEDYDDAGTPAIEPDSFSPINNKNKLILPKVKHQSPVQTDNTYIDHRVICILDDRSIMTVSPLSGSILNIIFPSTELDKQCLAIDVDHKGNSCYIVLKDSTMIEFDCTVNPGKIENFDKPGKRQKVLSVAEMEINMIIDRSVKRQQAVFLGLDNGQIKLCNDGSRQTESRSTDRMARRRSTRIGSGLVPLLTMENLKAHSGQVNLLYVPTHGSLTSDNEVINNILLTSGTDWRINVWRATTMATSKPLYRDIFLQNLKFFYWNEMPTCLALTNNVILLGYSSGTIEMHEFCWKNLSSMTGDASVYVDGCHSMLTGIKRIPLGKELQHSKKVRSADESHQLKLFVTSSLDGVVKLWDTDGLLIREILLGCHDPLVCFSLGRDILATFRNHIVRIASQDFLPNQYLVDLLEAMGGREDADVEPESPVPMESSELEVQDSFEAEEEIVSTPFKVEKVEKFGIQQRAMMLCSLMRKPKKKKKKIAEEEEMEQDEETSDEEFVMVDNSEVVERVDLSAEYVASLDKDRVKKYPVAPDGIIPNSVVRDIVPSTYPNPPVELLDFYALQQYLLGCNDALFDNDHYNQNQWEEMKMLLYESSSEDEVLSEESENNGEEGRKWRRLKAEREIELKKYLKGRREEGQMERKINVKTPTRRKSRKGRETAVEIIKQEKERRQSIMHGPPVQDFLIVLLEEVSKQMWCPVKITVKNIEMGLYAIAEVLASCSSRIASQICKFIAAIFEACQKSPSNTEHNELFPERMQRCLMHQMKNLFSFPSEHAQRSAANTLIKFDLDILKEFVMNSLMPSFLKRNIYTNQTSFHTEDRQIRVAAKKLAIFANIVDLDVLSNLGKSIGVKKEKDRSKNEEYSVGVIRKALEDAGSDPVVNQAWANFIIPILPENFLAITESMDELPIFEPDSPDKTMSLISVIVDIPEVIIPEKPARKPSMAQSNFIQQNIERVSSSNTFVLGDLAKASVASLDNPIKQVSLVNLPSRDQVFDNDKKVFGSDAGESSVLFAVPQASMDSIFAKTEIDNQKSSQTNILVDDLQHLSVSNLLQPTSMSTTLKNIHSKSNQMLNVRENPQNLRRESVGILQVMRRTSNIRSGHDLKSKMLKSQQDCFGAMSQRNLNVSQHYLRGSQQHFGTTHHDVVERKSQIPLPQISDTVKEEAQVEEDSGMLKEKISKTSALSESDEDQEIVQILQPEDLEEEIPIQPSTTTLSSSLKKSSTSKSSSAAQRIVHLGIIASKNKSTDSSKSPNEIKYVESQDLSDFDERYIQALKSSSSQSRENILQQESDRISQDYLEISSDAKTLTREELPQQESRKTEEMSTEKNFMFRDPTHYFASRVFLEIDLSDSNTKLRVKNKVKKVKRKKLPVIKYDSDLSKRSDGSSKQKNNRSRQGIQESMGSSAFANSISRVTATPSEDVVSEDDEKWRSILTGLRKSRLHIAVPNLPTQTKTAKKATVDNLKTDRQHGEDKLYKPLKTSIPPTNEITTALPDNNLATFFRPAIITNTLAPLAKDRGSEMLPSLFTTCISPRREIPPPSPVKSPQKYRLPSGDQSPLPKQSSLRKQFSRCLDRSRNKNKRRSEVTRRPKCTANLFPVYEWESKSMTFKLRTEEKLPVLIG